jgi:hypothetical protein
MNGKRYSDLLYRTFFEMDMSDGIPGKECIPTYLSCVSWFTWYLAGMPESICGPFMTLK